MGRIILLTGASGALGPHLLAELLRAEEIDRVVVLLRPGPADPRVRIDQLRRTVLRLAAGSSTCTPVHPDRFRPVFGDVRQPLAGLDGRDVRELSQTVDVIIHAAAQTSFQAPWSDACAVNVEGTRNLLELGRRCGQLSQFLLVSTSCVAGARIGNIQEETGAVRPDFLNSYERSKWEAERAAVVADLPVRIARLSTCLGSERDGYVHRFGAVHHVLHWYLRGLIPMIPGHDDARVDVIATEVAAKWIARAAVVAPTDCRVCHVAAGDRAPTLRQLLDCVTDHVRAAHPGRFRVEQPPIVDTETFALFRQSVEQTRDRLFLAVLRATDAFLPGLMRPKVYETREAEHLWGGPLPLSDWRSTIRRVIDFGGATRWSRRRAGREGCDAMCDA